MKAIQGEPQQGLDGPTSVDLPDPGDTGRDAIRVRVHATSLNFHDSGVVTGVAGCRWKYPRADSAGVVEAVGSESTGQARQPRSGISARSSSNSD
jgi:NADPH:quinone reductase-like Zn-dependent oxidoreductase